LSADPRIRVARARKTRAGLRFRRCPECFPIICLRHQPTLTLLHHYLASKVVPATPDRPLDDCAAIMVLMAQSPIFPANVRDAQLRHYRRHELPPVFVLQCQCHIGDPVRRTLVVSSLEKVITHLRNPSSGQRHCTRASYLPDSTFGIYLTGAEL
jgi:hypothetical protein